MTWTEIKTDQGKTVAFGAVIVLVILWLLWPSSPRRQRPIPPPSPAPQRVKPEAIRPRPELAKKAPPAPVPTPGEPSYWPGLWRGSGAQEAEMCDILLEIRPKPDGAFSGYSKITCKPLIAWAQPRRNIKTLLNLQPNSSTLAGTLKDGTLEFATENTIGRCTMKSFAVKPFGIGQMAVEWRDECRPGSMVLAKFAR